MTTTMFNDPVALMPVVLTTISQVMQIFPEPAIEEFDIPYEKVQGYILHESDVVRGLINYAYQMTQINNKEMELMSFGIDATGYINFVWNPDGAPITPGDLDQSVPMNAGVDYTIDMYYRTLQIKPSFELNTVRQWNQNNGGTSFSIADLGKPVEFTVVGGALNGTRQRAYIYDTNKFNDEAQELFLRQYSGVDPFIQRMTAILVALDMLKFWIKPLFKTHVSANIAGTQFSDIDKLPGWDDMQKRLEMAFKDMMDAIKKWGIRNGRVGDGRGMNPENPALLRSIYVATSVRGAATDSRTEYSPFMGWDDPFLFERPDRTSSVGDAIFGYTGRGFRVW